jgi:hypothetical protein
LHQPRWLPESRRRDHRCLDAAWPAQDCLKDLSSLGLDEEATGLFLRSNAGRVFGL